MKQRLKIMTSLLFKFPDKNPHLNEFVMNIKTSEDLKAVFDSIQKDSMVAGAEHQHSMDIS